MAISDELLQFGIDQLAGIGGISMDANRLVDDVVFVASAFNDPQLFSIAITNVVGAITRVLRQRAVGTALVNNKAGWWSYHFHSQRSQHHAADMRIVYQDTGTTIRIMGFCRRWLPEDIYKRLSLVSHGEQHSGVSVAVRVLMTYPGYPSNEATGFVIDGLVYPSSPHSISINSNTPPLVACMEV